MTVSIISSNAGADRFPLDALGSVGDLRWSHSYPGGCLNAQWSLDLSPNLSHPALSPGRRIELFDGLSNIWTGTLESPERGEPWSLQAHGIAALAGHFIALDAAGAVTNDPNTAVDQAIARGLQWGRRTTLPTAAALPTGSSGTLADLLNQVSAASGQRWFVGPDRNVAMTTDPTVATVFVNVSSSPGGRALEEYASALYGRYLDAAGAPKIAASSLNAATGGPAFGRREGLVDLTPAGPTTSSNAVSILNSRFGLTQARAAFTGKLTCVYGDVVSTGGIPLRLEALQAGVRVRVIGAASDSVFGELASGTVLEFTIGQIDITSGGPIQITPFGADLRDLSEVLTIAAAPQPPNQVEGA